MCVLCVRVCVCVCSHLPNESTTHPIGFTTSFLYPVVLVYLHLSRLPFLVRCLRKCEVTCLPPPFPFIFFPSSSPSLHPSVIALPPPLPPTHVRQRFLTDPMRQLVNSNTGPEQWVERLCGVVAVFVVGE